MSVFVDTNVLVYARDLSVPAKQQRAHEWMSALWESRLGRTSVQVLNEYYVTVTRKLTPGLAVRDARADVDDLRAWVPVPISARLVEAAFAVEDRFGLSYWDCLIVAAAQAADCDYLLTEDLQDGQRLDPVTVINPSRTGQTRSCSQPKRPLLAPLQLRALPHRRHHRRRLASRPSCASTTRAWPARCSGQALPTCTTTASG